MRLLLCRSRPPSAQTKFSRLDQNQVIRDSFNINYWTQLRQNWPLPRLFVEAMTKIAIKISVTVLWVLRALPMFMLSWPVLPSCSICLKFKNSNLPKWLPFLVVPSKTTRSPLLKISKEKSNILVLKLLTAKLVKLFIINQLRSWHSGDKSIALQEPHSCWD